MAVLAAVAGMMGYSSAGAMEVPPETVLDRPEAKQAWKKLARKYVDTSEDAKELRIAASIGDTDTVRELIEKKGVSPNAANQLIAIFLDKGALPDVQTNAGWTPLIYAARHGNLRAVKMLLHHGARLDIRDKFGRTALMLAAEKGHDDVVRTRCWNTARRSTPVTTMARRRS